MSKPKKLRKLIKAAKMRKPYAMYQLGICYETGRNVPQDIGLAVEWISAAAWAGYHTFEDSRYEGNVRHTRDGEVILEGYGTLYCNNGDVFSGLFRNDKLVEGFKYYKDERQLVYGSYDENGLPHGKATVLFDIDEKMYEGDFSHGIYQGKGKFQDYNGITYLCDWELDSAVNILEVYDLDGKLIPRSKAPFLYELERLKYTRIFAM